MTTTAAKSEEFVYKVAATTSTTDLGSTISHAVYDGKKIVLRALGAGAVNQAVKAIAVAQGFVAQRGIVLATRPGFTTVTIDGEEKTAVVLFVFAQ